MIPSPFAINLIIMGYSEILKIEDKMEFIRRMHKEVLVKIGMKNEIPKEMIPDEISYQEMWDKAKKRSENEKKQKKEYLKGLISNLRSFKFKFKEELIDVIDYEKKEFSDEFIKEIKKIKKRIDKEWPVVLKEYVYEKIDEEKLRDKI